MKTKVCDLLAVGSYKSLPHYSVHGKPSNFYVWVNEDGVGSASKWFKGAEAFAAFNAMRGMNKHERVALIKELHIKLGSQ